jgi:NADH:ubiquinone oxidoreductase subunit 3 (subunit A)
MANCDLLYYFGCYARSDDAAIPFLGPKGKQRTKNSPYESGIVSDNKTRFTNHFFLYAIFLI